MILRDPKERPTLNRFLDAMFSQPWPTGGYEFIWRRPRRSNKQNRYLWGVVYNTLAAGLSEKYDAFITPDHCHALCKQHFAPRIEIPGLNKTVPMSTTELTRSGNEESFQDYVTQIQQLAAERGIYIPDPNEVPHDYFD